MPGNIGIEPPAYSGKVGNIFFLSSLEVSTGIAPASCTTGVFTPTSVVAAKFLFSPRKDYAELNSE